MKKLLIFLMGVMCFFVLSAKDMNAPTYVFKGAVTMDSSLTLTDSSQLNIDGYISSPTITNLANQGAGYWFDGEDDYITNGTETLDLNSNWTVSFVHDYLSEDISNWDGIVTLTATGFDYTAGCVFTPNRIVLRYADNANSDAFAYDASGTYSGNNKNGHIVVTHTASDSTFTIYINGQFERTATHTHEYKTVSILNLGRQGTGDGYYNGYIKSVQIYNTALTASEVKDLYSGAPIPYSLTVHDNGLYTFDSDLEGWSIGTDGETATFTYDTDHANLAVTSVGTNSVRPSIQKTIADNVRDYIVGSEYLLTFDYTVNSGTCVFRQVYWDNAFIYTTELTTALTGSGTVTVELGEYSGAADNVILYWDGRNLFDVDIDNIRIEQKGAVLDLSPEGVGSYTWVDNSGNDNHGVVAGAEPTGLKPHHAWTAVEEFTTDATMTDAIPEDGLVEYIVVSNETANADTLNFGTSALASDIASNQVIPASETVTITINKLFPSETDVSVSDANGNGWNSTHEIKVIGRDE